MAEEVVRVERPQMQSVDVHGLREAGDAKGKQVLPLTASELNRHTFSYSTTFQQQFHRLFDGFVGI
jgi:hypothetical protein